MNYPDEDTIRILITTDNHVGYNENDPIIGDDAWKTFQEVMMIAKDNKVDMILQGGDLFHVNNPSKKSLYQVMKSLRLGCMGDKPCELELLSDPSKVFHYNQFTNVNYEDPNYNISIPMFAIAGNHDDATGESFLCPMDILQVSGLVNHFGKVMEADNINVVPLLFQKGNTKLALYGMASVRDERLFRTFKEGKVTFEVPSMREGEWFNIMCVHQNHTGHTNTAFLPEQFLPDFLDIVVWGHEHECIPHLVHNPTKNFDVLQAGSSVATSLCEAESKPKNVFILELKFDTSPKLIPIPLKSTRTFIMKSLALKDVEHLRPHDKESITRYLVEQVEELIHEANEETKRKLVDEYDDVGDDENLDIPLPLIRLRVDYSGPQTGPALIDYQVENPRRVSNKFVGRVANGNNVIQFFKSRRKPTMTKNKNATTEIRDTDIENIIDKSDGELEVQMLVNDLLSKMQLSLLPEVGMNEAVKKFVEKDEKSALKDFIDHEIDNEVDILASNKDLSLSAKNEHIKTLLKRVKDSNTTSELTPNQREAASDLLSNAFDVGVSDKESPNKDRIRSVRETTRTRHNKQKLTQEVNNSIVVSSEDEQVDNEDLDFVHREIANDEETISMDSSSRRKNVAPKSFRKVSSTPARKPKAGTRTPKTDILSSLLARKRK